MLEAVYSLCAGVFPEEWGIAFFTGLGGGWQRVLSLYSKTFYNGECIDCCTQMNGCGSFTRFIIPSRRWVWQHTFAITGWKMSCISPPNLRSGFVCRCGASDGGVGTHGCIVDRSFESCQHRLNWGPLRYVFNSPTLHLLHHSQSHLTQGGVIFISLSCWDYIFCTFAEPTDNGDVRWFCRDTEVPSNFETITILALINLCIHLCKIYRTA